jgi:hypothetical protein
MGSKKSAGRTGYDGPWKKKAAKKLWKKADAELTMLLKRTESGTINQKQLDSGLKDLTRVLAELDLHIHRAPEGPPA